MTVASTAPTITYLENGTSTVHSVPFQFIASTDLVVERFDSAGTKSLAVLGADYGVAGGAGAAGTVTMAVAKASGWSLRIRRVTARTQPTDYTPGDRFPAESHEAALDRVTMIAQETAATVEDFGGRALRVGEGFTIGTLPGVAARGETLLGFDVAGNPNVFVIPEMPVSSGYASLPFINILDIQANAVPGGTAFDAALNTAAAMYSRADATLDPNSLGGPDIWFPPGVYRFANSIDAKKAMTIRGSGTGFDGGHPTVFIFDADRHGIVVNAKNTVLGEIVAEETFAASGFGISGVCLIGQGAGAYHGIYARARFEAVKVTIARFGGHGIFITAGGVDGGPGNANGFRIDGGHIVECRGDGIRITGGDVNAGSIRGVDILGCGGWGIRDESFLGNEKSACHTSLNGTAGVSAGRILPACCTYGGFTWAVVPTLEAAAKTQQPGTGNAWLKKIGGEAVGGTVPAWASGAQDYLSGGGYCCTSAAGYGNLHSGCYAEGGQPPDFILPPGLMDMGIRGSGRVYPDLSVFLGMLRFDSGFVAYHEPGTADEIRAEFATGLANNLLARMTHATKGSFQWGWSGVGRWGFSTENEATAFELTLANSPYNFGRSAAVKGVPLAAAYFVGIGDGARAVTSAAALPSSGAYARGDQIINTDVAAAGSPGWRCTTSGIAGSTAVFKAEASVAA